MVILGYIWMQCFCIEFEIYVQFEKLYPEQITRCKAVTLILIYYSLDSRTAPFKQTDFRTFDLLKSVLLQPEHKYVATVTLVLSYSSHSGTVRSNLIDLCTFGSLL